MILEPNATHIMLDLETLGVTNEAPIISIGACCVTAPHLNFYHPITPVGSPEISTVLWWMEQAVDNPLAAQAAIAAMKSGHTPKTAAMNFMQWLNQPWVTERVVIWGNGASFDEPLLARMFKDCEYKAPWSFRDSRCYRTVVAQWGHLVSMPDNTGVAHNALDDAKYQADVLRRIHDAVESRTTPESAL